MRPSVRVIRCRKNFAAKEEFVLSQKSRDRLPNPAQIDFVPEQTYFMLAFEFKLTPANLQVFARTWSGRVPVKEGEICVQWRELDRNRR